jgi:hypothetical protein
VTPTQPTLDACFPTPATMAAFDAWDRHSRLCVAASWLDAISFGNFWPGTSSPPPLPSVIARTEGLAALASAASHPLRQTDIERIVGDMERLTDALRAHWTDQARRTYALRLVGLLGGSLVHVACIGLIVLMLRSGLTDLGVAPVAASWGILVVGSGLARRRWVDPALNAGSGAFAPS